VVATVNVEGCATPNVIEVGMNEQVGGEVRFNGATVQVKPTVPVNPFVGVTVTAVVLLCAACTVIGPAGVSVKLGTGAAVTVTVTGAVTIVDPLVPVTVTV